MKTFEQLREAHPTFYYKSYEINTLSDKIELVFHFSIENLASFSPRWEIPFGETPVDNSDENFKAMVFSLGLAELVSYWKITCSPTVVIEAGTLDEEQKKWWKKLYFNGLGEFFYINKINTDIDSFMAIVSSDAENEISPSSRPLSGNLVPVGGGKDSSVTLEVLRDFKEENHPYIINSRGATLESAAAAGLSDKSILVKRTLDKEMLRLNSEGYLNGHTPFSAVVAFSSVIAAYLHSLKYVVLSNESSANESTVSDSYVNHQYSKSFEFEEDFHSYEEKYLKSGVYYFSLLRPLAEYEIAALFSKYKKYHPIFKSCNRGSKENIWCAACPKCLFVYIIMSPFLSFEELNAVFGRDMASDSAMIPILCELTGLSPVKPFECVGSRAEVNFALCEAIKKNSSLPLIYEYYKNSPLYEEYSKKENPFGTYFDENNLLPEKFLAKLNKECSN